MTTTQRFQQLVHIECSSVEEEFFERASGLTFEKVDDQVKIEVRCWSSLDLSHFHNHETSDELNDSIASGVSSTDTAVGDEDNKTSHTEQSRTPRLQIIDLNCAKLQAFIRVSHSEFRVFYLRQRHSLSRLKITKDLFKTLVQDCDIFPVFTEYVADFQWKARELEIGPPPIRFRLLPAMGFESAYTIRYVEFTNRSGKSPWSLRQFTIYHKFCPGPIAPCSTWILVGASQRTERNLQDYFQDPPIPHAAHPFELHLVFLSTAIASWRAYLGFLVEEEAKLSNTAVSVMIGAENHPEDFVRIDVVDYQSLKNIEDRVSDVALCLDSTLDTIATFVEIHNLLYAHQETVVQREDMVVATEPRVDDILLTLKEKERHVAFTRKKAVALLRKAQNTRALISSLLERQTSHNLDLQMTALQNLEKEAYSENAIMRQIAEKSARDSTSVRILTILTLIYLPCTVVSSFYSTQFVSQKEREEGGVRMEYMDNAWLFFAVSIPLTVFTIMVWYTWSNAGIILDLFVTKREGQVAGFKERMKVMSLLRKQQELPR